MVAGPVHTFIFVWQRIWDYQEIADLLTFWPFVLGRVIRLQYTIGRAVRHDREHVCGSPVWGECLASDGGTGTLLWSLRGEYGSNSRAPGQTSMWTSHTFKVWSINYCLAIMENLSLLDISHYQIFPRESGLEELLGTTSERLLLLG